MSRPNPFARSWLYFAAWFDTQLDDHADPRVQVEQAVSDAQRRHEALTAQAAAVLGSERQVNLQLERQRARVADLAPQARQALVLADAARADGDDERAEQFDRAAQAAAEQLVSAEANVDELGVLATQAAAASADARRAVQLDASTLRDRIGERTALLAKLEQAKMQERLADSLTELAGFAAPGNVPTLDQVRDRIERRYAVASGRADLARDEGTSRLMEVQRATARAKADARLADIRATMSTADAEAADGDVGTGSTVRTQTSGT